MPIPKSAYDLGYHDPEKVLVGYRCITEQFDLSTLPYKVASLRTNGLRQELEGRQAALFCYGMTARLGRKVKFAFNPVQADSVDVYGLIEHEDGPVIFPIQLKEVPPPATTSTATLQQILDKAGRTYVLGDEPILAIHVNNQQRIELGALVLPTNVKEIYLFGAVDETQDSWVLLGDLRKDPNPTRITRFSYPTE